jgi:hypothetical protein
MCKYVVIMKNKEIKKLYTIRIHPKQLEYLRKTAEKNFTTVTQYFTDLINRDMKKNNYE